MSLVESFESQVQQWVVLDNQLKYIADKTKELREKKSALEKSISEHATANKVQDIEISDGRLKIGYSKVPEGLTFKYLDRVLRDIVKSEDQVNHLMEHIRESRTHKSIPEIRRFTKK